MTPKTRQVWVMRRAHHYVGEGHSMREAAQLAWHEVRQGEIRDRIYRRLGLEEKK